MISTEQIDRVQSEMDGAAFRAFELARQAERALEDYSYPRTAYEQRQYRPAKRDELLAAYREADYQAESRAWIASLIRGSSAKRGVPDAAVCFFRDGNKWCCVNGDFANLQESPAGFGETFEDAMMETELKGLGHGNGCPCGKCEWTDT